MRAAVERRAIAVAKRMEVNSGGSIIAELAIVGDARAVQVTEPTVGQAVVKLLRHPARQVIAHWNWKSALFSVLHRGSIFLIATLRRGAVEMSVAVGVEIVFAAVAVGIYSAFIQALRFARPRWLANLIIGVGLPGVLLTLDYLAHRYTGMHRIQASMIFLGFWSSLASLFNVFIMRRGVWLVGKQSEPLWRDLARMPALIGSFVRSGPAGYGNKLLVLNVEASRLSAEGCEDRLHAVMGDCSTEVNSET